MKYLIILITALFSLPALACQGGLLDQNFRQLASEDSVNLCAAYEGQVVLVVNTASKCAFTGQYEGLEKLYADYKDEGLVVLGTAVGPGVSTVQ